MDDFIPAEDPASSTGITVKNIARSGVKKLMKLPVDIRQLEMYYMTHIIQRGKKHEHAYVRHPAAKTEKA